MKTRPTLSAFGFIAYNYADAPGHERGDMGKGKPKSARVYSVYRIEEGIALCQSRDAWGGLYDERLPISTLEPYSKQEAAT